MNYINEQIIKTFEHLLNLRYKYGLMDLSSRKSRPVYRINQQTIPISISNSMKTKRYQ
jgi:hypothetical protein